MKTNPTKSLSEMTDFEKKKFAKKFVDAKKKLETHLAQLQICKQQHKPLPSFVANTNFFESLYEACEISLDALHGTPIEMFPTENQDA